MSTYYYLVCDKCKEYCDGASSAGGSSLIDSDKTLSPFIATHAYCRKVRIASEHEEDYENYAHWTRHSVKKLYEKERES